MSFQLNENDDDNEDEIERRHAIENLTSDMFNAVESNDITKLEALLRNGSDPDGLTDLHCRTCGKSILHVAVEKGKMDCAKMLLDYGAEIRMQDEWGISVFTYAVIDQYPDLAAMLLERNPEIVDIQDKYGKAALHCAIEAGNVELVKLILDNGGDVNIKDYDGVTPLMRLCVTQGIDCHVEIADMLLANGAMINIREFRNKMSALQYAVTRKFVGLVQKLLEAGADPNTMDGAFRTPITNLIWDNVRITDKNPEVDPDSMTIVILLTQSGADLNCRKCEYSNPLVMSAFLKAEPLVRFFLDFGADPNVTFRSGAHPLLVAVMKKHLPSVKALLDWGCRLNMKGRVSLKYEEEDNMDPMELAISTGCWDIVHVLIGAGYNLSTIPYLRDVHSDCKLPKTFQSNPEMFSYLQTLAMTPHSLYYLSIFSIRKAINNNIASKTDELPIPARLKVDISSI